MEIDLLSTRHGWEIRGELKVDKLRDVATRVEVLNWSSEEDLPHLARLMGGFVQACVPRIIWWLSS